MIFLMVFLMCFDGIRGTSFHFETKDLERYFSIGSHEASSSSITCSSNIKSKNCSVTNVNKKKEVPTHQIGTFLYSFIGVKYLPVRFFV